MERRDGVRAGGNRQETAQYIHRSLHNPAGPVPDPVQEDPVASCLQKRHWSQNCHCSHSN